MEKRGISTKVYYPYLLHQLRDTEHFETPNAEKFKEELFALPIYPSLTDEEVDYIVENLTDIAQRF